MNNRIKRILFPVLALLLGVALALGVFMAGERGFKAVNEHRKPVAVQSGGYTHEFFVDDALLGYKPKPDTRATSKKQVNGKTIYDVVYSIDRYGRRITPFAVPGGQGCLLFFGCSLAFGEGVNDDETLPFYLSQLLPGYTPYNYGCSGYGPQSMLAKLEDNGLAGEVQGKRAVLLYLFIDDHVNRATGSAFIVGNWGDKMPCYVPGENDTLVRKGSFRSERKLSTSLFKAANKTEFGAYLLNRSNTPSLKDEHIRLTCRIIEEAYRNFKKTFSDGDFYVVFYPGAFRAEKMMPCLEKAGVPYLDYHDREKFFGPEYHLPEDGHPTARAYRELAALIAQDLPSPGR
ncbi:MAG: hypothetical protein ACYC5N_05840 [Endomicrobiales bacterium]